MIIDMIRRGFTIIEIIIVITVMGALLILAVVNLRGSQISARDAERKTDIETIALHLDNYYTSGSDYSQSVGKYPSTALTSGQSLQVLVVAGGGGGGGNSYHGGGGGGGGVINTAFPVVLGSYPVTIGNGGAAYVTSNDGQNSVLGSLTAIGGGGGGSGDTAGRTGGSGGGAGVRNSMGGSATSGQGYPGGSGCLSPEGPNYGAGGGGGAGSGGGSGIQTAGGNGGSGLPSSISGAIVYYGGGGGGSVYSNTTSGTGGLGGGGAGAYGPGGGNGVANSGGGGGGRDSRGAENKGTGVGGSGIVIASYPTSLMTATGGTITYTDSNNLNPRSSPSYTGGYTIHTFTSSGTFTINSINNVTTNNIQRTLRDIDTDSITAPGITDPSQTFISATNNVQTTTGVNPQPTIDQYVYQPLQSDGTLCTLESQECRRFNLYYRLEADNTVYMVTGKNL